ncbi:MAG TPA: protoporphyrinogen oxidase [Vicinamibacterales bacterium]|nr:protoporphyrinogen oxidase [Vicinamibacterales bacterium]
MTPFPSRSGVDACRVVIVGGGIAGLTIAREVRAQAQGADVVVLERGDRIGGNIQSDRIDGYLCERGPDGFLDNAPATLALVGELGLTSRLLPSRDDARRRFIFRGDRLHEVAMSPWAFLTSPLLSPGGKLRVACEPFVRRAPDYDESVRQFAERHIGQEAARVLVGSMVSGIFAGDADQLSLRSCFPKMHDMDARYRSLVRAMLARRRERSASNGMGAPAGRLTSFVDGMEELVRAAGASLGSSVRTNQKVTSLLVRYARHAAVRPRLVGARAFSVTSNERAIEADAVVLAGPAAETAALVRPFAAAAAGLLSGIHTAPLAVVCLGYDDNALRADRGPLDGFGFLVPRGEGPRILGALWETSIYDHRAPHGKVLVRVMIGGASDAGVLDELTDAALLALVRDDLERTMGLRLAPEFVHIARHRRGIPQYTVGHDARLARIDRVLQQYPGLFVGGNSYRGVSVNACVEDAPRVAAQVVEHLRNVEYPVSFAAAR